MAIAIASWYWIGYGERMRCTEPTSTMQDRHE